MTLPELGDARALAGWLATFLIHSTLWIAGAWLAARGVRSAAWRARLWRAAALGGLATATLALHLRTTEFDWPLAEPSASVAALADVAPARPAPLAPALAGPLPAASRPAAALPAATATRAIDWIAVLVALWSAGALLGLLQLARAHRALARALADRRDLHGVALVADLARLASRAGLRGPVRLSVSPTLVSPVALARGEIVVPERALARLTRGEQESLVAHELAHLARRDPHWLVALGVLERLFWMQPLLRPVARRAGAAAELCCDESAAHWTGDRVALARCLAEVAGWVAGSAPTRLLVGMVAQPSALVERVEHLLAPRAAARFQGVLVGSWSAAMLAVLACSGPTVSEEEVDVTQQQAEIIRARIDPDGSKEVLVRPVGAGRIEISMPPDQVAEWVAEQRASETGEALDKLEALGYVEVRSAEDDGITRSLWILDDSPEAGIAFHAPYKDGQFATRAIIPTEHILSLHADGSIWCGEMCLLLPGVDDERLLRFHLAEIARCMPRADGVPPLPNGTLELRVDVQAAHTLLQQTLGICGLEGVRIDQFRLVPVRAGVPGKPLPFALQADAAERPQASDDTDLRVSIEMRPHSRDGAPIEPEYTIGLTRTVVLWRDPASRGRIEGTLDHALEKLVSFLEDQGLPTTCSQVVIDAYPGVRYGDVDALLDLLIRKGVTDIRFVGSRDR